MIRLSKRMEFDNDFEKLWYMESQLTNLNDSILNQEPQYVIDSINGRILAISEYITSFLMESNPDLLLTILNKNGVELFTVDLTKTCGDKYRNIMIEDLIDNIKFKKNMEYKTLEEKKDRLVRFLTKNPNPDSKNIF